MLLWTVLVKLNILTTLVEVLSVVKIEYRERQRIDGDSWSLKFFQDFRILWALHFGPLNVYYVSDLNFIWNSFISNPIGQQLWLFHKNRAVASVERISPYFFFFFFLSLNRTQLDVRCSVVYRFRSLLQHRVRLMSSHQ